MPTTIDRTTNLIFRDGHLIGRAVPRFEQPPFGGLPGSLLIVYQIIDRQGRSYGFGSSGRSASLFETVDGRITLIPPYLDQPEAEGEMLTRMKQRRDTADFQVQLCRRQWAKMRREHRDGQHVSPETRKAVLRTYRLAQADRRRFANKAIEQEAADIAATAYTLSVGRMIGGMLPGMRL